MGFLRHRIIIEDLALQPVQAGVRAHPNSAIRVFGQRANGPAEQLPFRTKESYALFAKSNQPRAPSGPQVPVAVLEQRQDRLAQEGRSGRRFEPSADSAKQAGMSTGPKVGVAVFEQRGDMQTGQARSEEHTSELQS